MCGVRSGTPIASILGLKAEGVGPGRQIAFLGGFEHISPAVGWWEARERSDGAMLNEKLVLLVDDEPAILKATAAGLSDRGFKVEGVSGADAAMRSLQTHKPSIIVSDLVMPGTNGFEFYEKVKSARGCGSIPFVFLTAVDDYYAQKFGKQMGSAAYITKPVDFNELERVLLEKLGE